MEIVVDAQLIWNILLTLILAPVGLLVRSILSEQKRLDILLNKTREEIAREYITREEVAADFERIVGMIQRIDEKLDRFSRRTFFQE